MPCVIFHNEGETNQDCLQRIIKETYGKNTGNSCPDLSKLLKGNDCGYVHGQFYLAGTFHVVVTTLQQHFDVAGLLLLITDQKMNSLRSLKTLNKVLKMHITKSCLLRHLNVHAKLLLLPIETEHYQQMHQ